MNVSRELGQSGLWGKGGVWGVRKAQSRIRGCGWSKNGVERRLRVWSRGTGVGGGGCGWDDGGWGGRKGRFEEAKFVEHHRLEGCELRCHGVLEGRVRVKS